MNRLGIYIHVPFCDGKCPYCDFYSLSGGDGLMDAYVEAVKRAMAGHEGERIGTAFFGGGTPSLLGADRLSSLLESVRGSFDASELEEVTVETNPSQYENGFFERVRAAGFHRLSMGLQSANGDELAFLGRRHTAGDAARAVREARAAGFGNISLDLMLGLPGSGREKLGRSIDFAASLGVEHISAYILKVEPGTPFAARGVEPPDDDAVADQYLFCVEELRKRGYRQYEISNFAKPGFESRHNLLYWHGEEYLGFGPGAHSFFGGRRYFYPRDLEGFLRGRPPAPDGEGGSFSEYAMLNLRLAEGLRREACRERFGLAGERGFDGVLQNAKKCPPSLVRADGGVVSFTPEGFLVSNSLILRLLP